MEYKTCRNCRNYQAYYRNAHGEFLYVLQGYCFEKKTVVCETSDCKSWELKPVVDIEKRKREAYYNMQKATALLAEVKQLLEK